MPEKRGLRGKQRRDADDRAVERAKAERLAREAALAVISELLDELGLDVDALNTFKNRSAGFAPSGNYASAGHQHGWADINSVKWSVVGTGDSPVPDFAKKSDIAALKRYCNNTFKKV